MPILACSSGNSQLDSSQTEWSEAGDHMHMCKMVAFRELKILHFSGIAFHQFSWIKNFSSQAVRYPDVASNNLHCVHRLRSRCIILALFFFPTRFIIKFKRISSKYCAATSKHQLKGVLATSKWHVLIVYSGCCHGKMLTDQQLTHNWQYTEPKPHH